MQNIPESHLNGIHCIFHIVEWSEDDRSMSTDQTILKDEQLHKVDALVYQGGLPTATIEQYNFVIDVFH